MAEPVLAAPERRAPVPAPAPVPARTLVAVPARDPSSVPATMPAEVATTLRAPGAGEPLPHDALVRLSSALGADLRAVRLHVDPRARAAAARLGARAFAYGRRIFLGPGERAGDLPLLAHEAAHVVQQTTGATVQLFGDRAAPAALEREAASAGQAAAAGQTAVVQGRAGGALVQRQEAGFFDIDVNGLVRRWAPELAPVFEKGAVAWLEERLTAGFEALVELLLGPVRRASAAIATVRGHFTELMGWMREAAAQIAKGDCSSLTRAAERIQATVEGVASPVVDKVKEIAGEVGDFLKGLWDRFGAPAWEFLKRVGGVVWDQIVRMATRFWDNLRPVRDAAAFAWDWVKRQLGLGDTPDGQDGLLQWVQRKAGEAWERIRARVEPYKRQLMVAAGILVLLSPAGPIIAIAAAAAGLIQGVRWIARNLATPDGVVRSRTHVRDVVIAGIQRAVAGVTAALRRGAAFVTEKLTALVGSLSKAVGALAGSILAFLARAAEWLLGRVQELATWAVAQLGGLADLVEAGLAKLDAWLAPVHRVLGRVGDVLARAAEVVFMAAERVWNLIPACVRDPIVNFLVEHLLKKIPIVAAILDIPDLWNRLKGVVRTVIRKLFKGLDLFGAALEVFKLILDVLKVPLDLIQSIFKKAGNALDAIFADPVRFLTNLLMALRDGFAGFFRRFWGYLRDGLIAWLTDELPPGVTFPRDFSLSGIFGFVVGILGITLEKIWAIVQRKVAEPVYRALRAAARVASGAWEFISVAVTEGVGGLWRKVTEKLTELKDMLVDAIVGWVVDNVIDRVTKRLLSMLDPTGIMAVVNAIVSVYQAIQAAVEYLRGMLEIVDKYLDMVLGIASGAIGAAAARFESLLARAVPIAIGFLGYQVGLSKVGRKVREMIAKVQKWVEEKLEWLVEKAVKAGGAIVAAVKGLLGVGEKSSPTNAAAGESAEFEVDGVRHKVYTDATGGTIMVASNPSPVDLTITEMSARVGADLPRQQDKEAGGAALKLARDAVKALRDVKTAPTERHTAFGSLVDAFKVLYRLVGHRLVPETEIRGIDANPPTAVIAEPLTRRAGTVKGSESTSRMEKARSAMTSLMKWRRMHLLSARAHGPNAVGNLVPGPQAANSNMYSDVEEALLERLSERNGQNVLWYHAAVSPAGAEYPVAIDVSYGEWDPVAKAPVPGAPVTTKHVHIGPRPDPATLEWAVDLSRDGAITLQRTGMNATVAEYIAGVRLRNPLLAQRGYTQDALVMQLVETRGIYAESVVAELDRVASLKDGDGNPRWVLVLSHRPLRLWGFEVLAG